MASRKHKKAEGTDNAFHVDTKHEDIVRPRMDRFLDMSMENDEETQDNKHSAISVRELFGSLLDSECNSVENDSLRPNNNFEQRNAKEYDSSEKANLNENNILDQFSHVGEENIHKIPEIKKSVQSEDGKKAHSSNVKNTIQGLDHVISNLADYSQYGNVRKELYKLKKMYLKQYDPNTQNPSSISEEKEKDRATRYENAQREIKKWIPLVSANDTCEQLRLTGAPENLNNTMTDLASKFSSLNDFERQLENAIRESDVSESTVMENKSMSPDCEILRAERHKKLARIKALIFEEQRNFSRQSKIKSRMWRKIHRRSENLERDNILEWLDREDPEVAANIRHDYEEKRARIRLLKEHKARQKWSKVALRYGGSDARKLVADQFQKAHDEKKAIENVIRKSHSEDRDGSGDESSNDEKGDGGGGSEGENSEGDSDDLVTSAKKVAASTKLKIIKELQKNGEKDTSPREGLMGLRFMQQAIAKQRDENKKSAEDLLRNLDADLNSYLQNKDGNDENAIKLTNDVQPSWPVICEDEVQMAERKLNPSFPKCKNNSSPEPQQKHHAAFNDNLVESSNSGRLKSEKAKKGSLVSNNSSFVLDEIVNDPDLKRHCDEADSKSFEPAAFDDKNVNEIYEIFSSSNHVNEFEEQRRKIELDEADMSKTNDKKTAKLPGWGRWTNSVAQTVKVVQTGPINSDQRNNSEKRVVISRRLDRKLAKYFVKQCPSNFENSDQYNFTVQRPIGEEWNTGEVHKRIIQPKVLVRNGSIVRPLEMAKRMTAAGVDSMLASWDDRKKRIRTHSRL